MSPENYDFWTSVGTVGAVVVALLVALTQATVAIVISIRRNSLARRKVASLVSAWLDHEYLPSEEGTYYRRSVTLRIANESDEPVFNVEVTCGIETEGGVIRVGPLAAPRVIPILPPKREFVYDVTMGMLGFGQFAHDSFRGLVAEIGFRDHQDVLWLRDFSGKLGKVLRHSKSSLIEANDDISFAQAGPVEHPYNPLGIVLAFAATAGDGEVNDQEFRGLLSSHAPGWGEMSEEDLQHVRKVLRTANLALHVWYPTPRIAYVRLVDSQGTDHSRQAATVLTLVWRNRVGWRFFGVGPYLPWDIGFDEGELYSDPLDGRDSA
jgi:hypothetical protein